MKPLITTVAALGELAAGLSPDAVESSEVLFSLDTPEMEFLISTEDGEGAQRIVIMRDKNSVELCVPDHLAALRRDVLSRMTSFSERAKSAGPLSLPRQWHQYKYNNYVAFRAVPKSDPQFSRWIAEVSPGDRADIIFWEPLHRTRNPPWKTSTPGGRLRRSLRVNGLGLLRLPRNTSLRCARSLLMSKCACQPLSSPLLRGGLMSNGWRRSLRNSGISSKRAPRNQSDSGGRLAPVRRWP